MIFRKSFRPLALALGLLAPIAALGQSLSITSVSATALPQHNGNLPGVSAPTELLVQGMLFQSGATAKFSGTGFTTFSVATTFISSTSLRVDTPQVPTAATSLSIQICNTATNCTAAKALSILALTVPAATLTPTATTPVKYSFEADFGSAAGVTAGLPAGTVTFKDGATSLGTVSPVVKSQALVKAVTPGTWTTNSNTATQRSLVADFDRDGLPDVVVYDSSTGLSNIHILLGANNRGDFNGDMPVSLGFSPSCSVFADIAVGDFNNDGYPDIALLCNNGSITNNGYIYLLLNKGDATFTATPISLGRGASMLAVGDMNKDGNLDLIVGGQAAAGVGASFMVMFGNGTGSFPTSKTSSAANALGQQMLAVDLNNDGYPDLLTGNTGTTAVYAWKNDGTGGFPATANYSRANTTTRFSIGRIAGSPYPNLLLGASGGVTEVNNNADGTVGFGNTGYLTTITNLKFFVAGDVTGDGSDDLITYDGTNIAVYPWQSAFFGLSPSTTVADAQTTSFAGTGDFNADGFADVVALDDPKATAPYSDKVQTYIASGVLAATLANQTLTPGSHTITATDLGTVAFAAGSASTAVTAGYSDTVSLTVTPATPTTYVGGTSDETLKLTVTYTSGQPAAAGTVTFYNNGAPLGPFSVAGVNATTSAGTVSLTLPAGSHSIYAVYSGDANYGPSTTATQTYVINKAAQTISFPQPATPATSGTSVTLTATGGASGNPVVFSVVSGPATVSGTNGSTLTYTGAGTVVVAADQAGTANYNAATQVTRTVTVNVAVISTTTNLSSYPNPSTVGNDVYFEVDVTGATSGPAITGTVTVYEGTTNLGSSALTSDDYGTVYIDVPGLTVGSHNLTAVYAPDTSSYTGSTSPVYQQEVDTIRTLITWTQPADILAGTPLTFRQLNATATDGSGRQSEGIGQPGPTQDGGPAETNGTGNKVPGTFVYNPPAGTVLSVGQHTLSVTFTPSDPSTYSSGSATVTINVTAAITDPGTLTATPNPATTINPVVLRATFGDPTSLAGIPSGLVTFKDNTTTVGTAALQAVAEKFVAANQQTFGTNYNGGNPLAPIIADLNQDGIPDVLAVSADGTISVLAGADHYGNLMPEDQLNFNYPLCCETIKSIVVADFNQDGFPDIALLTADPYSGTDSVAVLLNYGDGTFNTYYPVLTSLSTLSDSMAAADFNKDGKIDLVLSGATDTSGTAKALTVAFGDGTGNFPTQKQTVNAAADGTQILAADLNNDSYPDVVVSTPGGATTVFKNDGTGGFGAAPVYTHTFTNESQIFTARTAASAYPNLIVASAGASGTISVVQNNKTAALGFSATPTTTSIANLQTVAVGDFNGDANPDVATYDGTTISIYNGSPTGTYSTPLTSFASATASNLLLASTADVNGDGYADLLALTPSVSETQDSTAQFFVTTGSASASLPAATYAAGTHPLSATIPATVTYAAGTASASLMVTAPTAAVALTVSPVSPTTYSPNGTETLTATLTTAQAPAATMSVKFYDGTTLLGTGPLTAASSTVSTASITIGPLMVGTHPLTAQYAGDGVYGASNSTATNYVVNKGTPVLTFAPNPATIPYGTALSSAQLDATATLGGATVAGTFTYNPVSGTVLGVGANQVLSVSFVPTDTADYNSPITRTATVTVTKSTPTITWAMPANIVYGTPLSGTQLNANATNPVTGATVAGAFTYTPPAGTVLPVGSNPLSVTFLPTDATDYNNGAGATTQVVTPATFVAPTTPVGSMSLPQTAYVTVTTAGTPAAINVLTQGAPNLDFKFLSGGTCATITPYAANAVCSVMYTFSPTAPGARLGAITLTSGSTLLGTTYISGVGTGPLGVILPGAISTVAGNGTVCTTSSTAGCADGGLATSGTLNTPYALTLDGLGNLYIADLFAERIRKVTAASGIISTIAGNGTASYVASQDTGTTLGSNTSISNPAGVAVDGAGNVYIADENNQRVRKVSALTGNISTVAGDGAPAYNASEDTGTTQATNAALHSPGGVAIDGAGNLYIADVSNQRIRKVSAATGTITTVAGNGTQGYVAAEDTGTTPATSTSLSNPYAVALDAAGNLFIVDSGNVRIRKVSAGTGYISTVAGNGTSGYVASQDTGSVAATSAELNDPTGIAVDTAGNLYIADRANLRIRKVNAGTGFISTVAGNGTATYVASQDTGTGSATSAGIYGASGVAVDGVGNIYLNDQGNVRVRKVTATPAPLAFPATMVLGFSGPQTDILSNNGNASLTLTGLASTSSSYTLTGSTCTSTGTVAAGGSCNIAVTFTPQTLGPVTGTINATDNSLNVPGSVQSIAVSGSGAAVVKTINFPQPTTPATYGTSATLTATASNGDPVTYTILSGTASLSGSTITYTSIGSVTIAADSAANGSYSAAAEVTRTVTVTQATQAINFTQPATPATIGSVHAVSYRRSLG